MSIQVYEVFDPKGRKVGETTRHPATVFLEAVGNPIDPDYKMVDGNGDPVLGPDQEVQKLEAEIAASNARIKALEDTKSVKADEASNKEVVPHAPAPNPSIPDKDKVEEDAKRVKEQIKKESDAGLITSLPAETPLPEEKLKADKVL